MRSEGAVVGKIKYKYSHKQYSITVCTCRLLILSGYADSFNCQGYV